VALATYLRTICGCNCEKILRLILVSGLTAFTPAVVPTVRGNTAVCANKFGQAAPQGAPPADLFNIWRDDYMLTPAEAAAEVRNKDAYDFVFFDPIDSAEEEACTCASVLWRQKNLAIHHF